jgi:hypothetical protein
VASIFVIDELAEGPGTRWLGIVPDGLREQTCPDRAIVKTFAVLGSDFESPSPP